MKAKDLRNMSTDELHALEASIRKELFKLRLSHFAGEGEFSRVAEFKTKRRTIARIKTILGEQKRANAQ